MNPSAAVTPLRTAPPGSGCASRTRTSQPASARRLAATRPLCPAPMTTASAMVRRGPQRSWPATGRSPDPTLQWTPRRGVLLAARVTVPVVVATVTGVVLALVADVAAAMIAPDLTLTASDLADSLGGIAAVLLAGGALAGGGGVALRHHGAGAGGVVLLALGVGRAAWWGRG